MSGSASSTLLDVATDVDVKSNAVLQEDDEGGAVAFIEKSRAWKSRPVSSRADTSTLFCASNNPVDHTMEDAGRFFQIDGSTNLFDIFYHNGYCGENVAARSQQLKTSAMLVRRPGLMLRDELLALDSAGSTVDSPTPPLGFRRARRSAPRQVDR